MGASTKHRITIIGSGNVAWHLAPALDNVGYIIGEVSSRNPQHAHNLAKRLYQAHVVEGLDFSESDSDLFILAVSDEAIEEVATEIILPEKSIVAHTSGSQPLSLLGYLPTEHIGVFYPLQTFSKGKKVDFENIPFCIESDSSTCRDVLWDMASLLSKHVLNIGYADRRTLHIAAIFACNFTNHMMTLSKQILDRKGLDFEVLHPLISETINKTLELGPEEGQTGPALRNDQTIIDQHLQYLANNEDLLEIYRMISQHITQMYSTNT